MKKKQGIAVLSLVTTMIITTGCAGSAGSQSGSNAEGFAHGAEQSMVDQALSALEPIEIKYQAVAASSKDYLGQEAEAFKKYVETRSNGKVTVKVVWGQAVANFAEVDDALADGRLDVAQTIPHYDSSAYPALDAFNMALQGIDVSSSPIRGDLMYGALAMDLALNTEGVVRDFENNGVTPMFPIISAGTYNYVCNSPGSEPDDWHGRVVRVPSKPHEGVVNAMGATATSLAFTETYEGFQRNTVQCSLTQLAGVVDNGMFEVAPNLLAFDSGHALSRPSSAIVMGTNVDSLPLPYQQIIFDASTDTYATWFEALEAGTADSLRQVHAKGGEVSMISEAAQKEAASELQRQGAEAMNSEVLGPDFDSRVDEAITKWESILDELEITDDRSFEELAEDPSGLGENDYAALAERVFDEVLASRRPE